MASQTWANTPGGRASRGREIDETASFDPAPARRPDPVETGRFQALVLPHLDAAYNLALRLTRSPEAAEDIVHDALVRGLTGFTAFRGEDARAWILAIVRNRAFDWLRELRRKAMLPLGAVFPDDPDREDWEPLDPDLETAEEALIRRDAALDLHRAIDALPPRLREVLVLREMEDLSYRQIAEITASPIGSVMSRLARARAQLGEMLRRAQAEESGT